MKQLETMEWETEKRKVTGNLAEVLPHKPLCSLIERRGETTLVNAFYSLRSFH